MSWWLAIGALLCLLTGLTLGACGDDDDDDDDDDNDDNNDAADDDATDDDNDCFTDVEEVCDYIFANGDDHWGQPSIDLCYSDFMSGCADADAYFTCVCQCYAAADCEEFTACEAICWGDNCE